jgi:lathosterol oxidase
MAILQYLQQQPPAFLWLIFFIENIVICLLSLMLGRHILQLSRQLKPKITTKEYWLCLTTNILNTVITYSGFSLWQHGYIVFGLQLSWLIIPHFLLLFMAMDLLMFMFHFCIHQKFIYKYMHGLHHQYHNPSPIDLYVLHPIETIGFGSLWLFLISIFNFNLYAVIIYLAVNVLSGIIGHLGFEPFPVKLTSKVPFKYLGTSRFHHTHHTHVQYNYGFYTVLWDKIFKTYKP